jgi:hypothetical protein
MDVGEVVVAKLDFKVIHRKVTSVKSEFWIRRSYGEAHGGAIVIGEHLLRVNGGPAGPLTQRLLTRILAAVGNG